MSSLRTAACALVLAAAGTAGYHLSSARSLRTHSLSAVATTSSNRPLIRAVQQRSSLSSYRAVASAALPNPVELVPPTNGKISRVLTAALFCVVTLTVLLSVYPFVIGAVIFSLLFDNKRRRWVDRVVQLWARATMEFFGASVEVIGKENLPPPDEAVMYTPNHCSFLDIFILSGYLPRPTKYISKIEILRIPLIGWAMGFARHIAIRRMDRKSQLKTLRDAIETLKDGNSLVTFPEGTRSKDGKLLDFKKGPFTMAARAGVRVVPVTIVGTHLFQPPGAFVPLAVPRGVRVVIHPPIDAPPEKQEEAALQAAKAAVVSALPPSMLPLEKQA